MPVHVRGIRPEECDALGELTVRVYTEIDATDEEYSKELRDVAGRCETCDVLVAVDGDRVVGGVAFVPGPGPWADRAGDDEAEIRMLVVDPAQQRRGIGETLVQRCIALARERDRARIVLLSERGMTAAHRLYDRLGFVRTPDRDWDLAPGVYLLAYVLDL